MSKETVLREILDGPVAERTASLTSRVRIGSPPMPPPVGRVEFHDEKGRFAADEPVGRVQFANAEFANPYHDERGRFAKKGEGRRVPTRGVADEGFDDAALPDWQGTPDQVRAAINQHVAANPLSETSGEDRYDDVAAIMSEVGLKSALNTDAMHNHLGEDNNRWTEERHEQHQEILTTLMQQVEEMGIPKGRECLVLGGLPGSGKSYSLGPEQVAEELGVVSWESDKAVEPGYTHVSINSDLMKSILINRGMLPGGVDGLKPMEQVNFIHKESSYLAKQFQKMLQREGYNVTLDGTLDSDPRDKIEPLIDHGYTFKGLFADVPLTESIASAKDRYVKAALTDRGGRFVPPEVQLSGGAAQDGRMSPNRNVFDRLAGILPDGTVTGDGLFGEFMVVDNTGIINRRPRKEVTDRGSGSGRNPYESGT